MIPLLDSLIHPYARYGLAVALFLERKTPEIVTEEDLPEILARAIESGLGSFRMETLDDPALSESLGFRAILMSRLQADPKLVQGSLAGQGKYLFPSVVTEDGDARGTFGNSMEILEQLRKGVGLARPFDFKRSFAPTVAKINNGKSSQTVPRGSLFEAACVAITTLTPLKPAAWAGMKNTALIPDLDLDALRVFVRVFHAMQVRETRSLMETARRAPAAGKKNENKAPYRRPPLHNGNYPFAPRDTEAFGAVGLLGAIGRWASTADEGGRADALRVLDAMQARPIYVINYDRVLQVQFSHHTVALARDGRLSELIDALITQARLYVDIEATYPRRDSNDYRLFYLMTSRFLQQFNQAAFRSFLSTRAEYPEAVHLLLKEYFVNEQQIRPEIVAAARALGQWLNFAAYRVARDDAESPSSSARSEMSKEERGRHDGAVRKAKAKLLVEFEGAAMSAKDPADLLFRVTRRAGLLVQDDAPHTSEPFFDAAASGEISLPTAQHLLIAYMRLRARAQKTSAEDPYAAATDPDSNPDETPDDAEPAH